MQRQENQKFKVIHSGLHSKFQANLGSGDHREGKKLTKFKDKVEFTVHKTDHL